MDEEHVVTKDVTAVMPTKAVKAQEHKGRQRRRQAKPAESSEEDPDSSVEQDEREAADENQPPAARIEAPPITKKARSTRRAASKA